MQPAQSRQISHSVYWSHPNATAFDGA